MGVPLYDALSAAPPSKLVLHRHMGSKRFIGKLVERGGALYYVTYRDRESTLYRKHNSFGITRQVLDVLYEVWLEQQREVYVAILERRERKVYLSRLWDWLRSPLRVEWGGEVQVHLPVDHMCVLE